MISRRDFLKDTATIGITAAAAAAFWNAAPKSVEAYRDYINERMAAFQPLPRKPKPSSASEVFVQYVTSAGAYGAAWPEIVKNAFLAGGGDAMIDPGDMVILKQHLGERNRESYLRPSLVRTIAAEVKAKGGNPLVCDTTTAYYPSARYYYLNYYDTALSHGYTEETCDAPVVPFSDGRWGADHLVVPIDGNQLNAVGVAQLISEGDVLVAFTHAKGHPSGIMGGTLKNLGIGGASAHGKGWDHVLRGNPTKTDWTPMQIDVDPFACPGTANCPAMSSPWILGDCTRWCPYGAYAVGPNGMTKWDPTICSTYRCYDGCAPAMCFRLLPGAGCTAGFVNKLSMGGLSVAAQHENLGIRYTDTATGCWWLFPDGKALAMNIMKDIQPWCDCCQHDGLPLVPDIGVAAVPDICAIDECFADLVQASPSTPGSLADSRGLGPGDEKFGPVNTGDPHCQTIAAERLGAGTREYTITTVEPTVHGLWGTGMPFWLHYQSDKWKGSTPASEKRWNDPRAYYR